MDSRFKLEDQYKADVSFNRKMKKNVGSVMKALEGEMELSHNAHKKHTPFKHNLLSRERSIEQVSGIFGMFANNSQTSVSLNPQNVKCLFVPNLNIKEIIIVQDESRLRQIKARNDIIDI